MVPESKRLLPERAGHFEDHVAEHQGGVEDRDVRRGQRDKRTAHVDQQLTTHPPASSACSACVSPEGRQPSVSGRGLYALIPPSDYARGHEILRTAENGSTIKRTRESLNTRGHRNHRLGRHVAARIVDRRGYQAAYLREPVGQRASAGLRGRGYLVGRRPHRMARKKAVTASRTLIIRSDDLEPSVGEIDALARAARLEYRDGRTQGLRDFASEEGIPLVDEE